MSYTMATDNMLIDYVTSKKHSSQMQLLYHDLVEGKHRFIHLSFLKKDYL